MGLIWDEKSKNHYTHTPFRTISLWAQEKLPM